MAPSLVAKFVEGALSNKGHFSLSYQDRSQKWLLRDDMISLLKAFPCLQPLVDTYTYEDGTMVKLLKAQGILPIPTSSFLPPIELTIWLHQDYPSSPPLIYLSTLSPNPPLRHPYVDSSGNTRTPYLEAWRHPSSCLIDLVRNLLRIFSEWSLYDGISPFVDRRPNLFMSRREAIDRLTIRLTCDIATFEGDIGEDMDNLRKTQSVLEDRALYVKYMMYELEREKTNLKKEVKIMVDKSDMLLNWLKANDRTTFLVNNPEDVFKPVDKVSSVVIEHGPVENSIDDVMRALDKIMERRGLALESYLRQIRTLAREQFRAIQEHFKVNPTMYIP